MARQIVFYGNVSNREDTMHLVVAFAKRSNFAKDIPITRAKFANHFDMICNLDDISCQFE